MKNEFIKATIRPICSEMYHKKKLQNYKVNEDTNTRLEIQTVIRNSINEGMNEKQIIKKLNQNSKYEKYKTYFSNWISDVIKKTNAKNKQNDQER